VRICLDCRKVNSFTEKDAYPLPQTSGILSRLPRAEYITSLDLKDAYCPETRLHLQSPVGHSTNLK